MGGVVPLTVNEGPALAINGSDDAKLFQRSFSLDGPCWLCSCPLDDVPLPCASVLFPPAAAADNVAPPPRPAAASNDAVVSREGGVGLFTWE